MFFFFSFRDDNGSISGGDRSFEIFEFVMMDHRVVSFVFVEVVIQEVSELSSKDSVLHMCLLDYIIFWL